MGYKYFKNLSPNNIIPVIIKVNAVILVIVIL